MRILVAGASGMIGRALVRRLRAEGYFVDVLVRGRRAGAQGEYAWDPVAGTIEPFALAGADAVINLSGASISRIPWTRDYQRELVSSRILTTRLLAESMAAMDQPPPVFLSASAVGFYGDRPRVRLDDDSPKGDGFLSDLVLAWEQASALAHQMTIMDDQLKGSPERATMDRQRLRHRPFAEHQLARGDPPRGDQLDDPCFGSVDRSANGNLGNDRSLRRFCVSSAFQ